MEYVHIFSKPQFRGTSDPMYHVPLLLHVTNVTDAGNGRMEGTAHLKSVTKGEMKVYFNTFNLQPESENETVNPGLHFEFEFLEP